LTIPTLLPAVFRTNNSNRWMYLYFKYGGKLIVRSNSKQ